MQASFTLILKKLQLLFIPIESLVIVQISGDPFGKTSAGDQYEQPDEKQHDFTREMAVHRAIRKLEHKIPGKKNRPDNKKSQPDKSDQKLGCFCVRIHLTVGIGDSPPVKIICALMKQRPVLVASGRHPVDACRRCLCNRSFD